ncbi:MAG: D-alanyl-D-alanine carboxypeptidase family protein [Eubacteriales bacterium]|nr:D-alanyl-D-alanine carboxypeptidase family protein [Eubacteriales bacterium]
MKTGWKRRLLAGALAFCLGITGAPLAVCGQEEGQAVMEAPSGILMESKTGEVLLEKEADTRRSPASITKIMTLILIFDAIREGRLKLTDTVTTSAYAKSMGGSQVFLEEGETQDVETMIKCIVIASGNDASVAMAEHLCGSEEEFVREMNLRAEKLGMKNTHFEDCCGLTDSPEHYTSARDVALMSRELIEKYPEVLDYSSIWMENMTHVTRQGSSEFTLTNTNKLLRSYEGCLGLKTGSTSLAKYCLSAVARRKGVTLIAVVMAAPDYKVRFRDAASLLNYGFSKCSLYVDESPSPLPFLQVKRGTKGEAPLVYEKTFHYLSLEGAALDDVKKRLILPESVQAPVKKGEKAGVMEYYAGEKKLGTVDILYGKSVGRATYGDCLRKAAGEALL